MTGVGQKSQNIHERTSTHDGEDVSIGPGAKGGPVDVNKPATH